MADISKIKIENTEYVIRDLEATALINNLIARLNSLEAALANKQDKIYNWGDLANTADTNLVNVAEEGA